MIDVGEFTTQILFLILLIFPNNEILFPVIEGYEA